MQIIDPETLYFRDGKRKIDMVLVYEEEELGVMTEAEARRRDNRKVFQVRNHILVLLTSSKGIAVNAIKILVVCEPIYKHTPFNKNTKSFCDCLFKLKLLARKFVIPNLFFFKQHVAYFELNKSTYFWNTRM